MPTIQFRRGTKRQWIDADPVLAPGEPGFETDSGLQKIGDGTTPWSELPYFLPHDAAGPEPAPNSVAGEGVGRIVALTQAEYEGTSPQTDTLYLIMD